jgi:predicted O-methyltransferase YrrM
LIILFRIISFIKYYLKSGNAHGLHSPFVFDLYNDVISTNKQFYHFDFLEKLRLQLQLSKESITLTDFGAGNNGNIKSSRLVKDIAQSSLSGKKKCELLFKLVNKFQPQNIIEIGTSLGISTLYLSLPNSKSNIYTFEGSENILNIANLLFKSANCKNIKTHLGNFNHTLEPALKILDHVDMVFFDGNHQYQPTINYYEICLAKSNETSIFIFDDIYWSPDMQKAWKEIINRPEVTVSIDLFEVGIVFFRKNQAKENFTLRF